jgi:hypothetical protein
MQTEEGKSRFGRCPYCRAMIYQDLSAIIFYCSRCRTPIRGTKDELLLARDAVPCRLLCSPTRPPPLGRDRLTASPPALVQARTRNPRTRPSTRSRSSRSSPPTPRPCSPTTRSRQIRGQPGPSTTTVGAPRCRTGQQRPEEAPCRAGRAQEPRRPRRTESSVRSGQVQEAAAALSAPA